MSNPFEAPLTPSGAPPSGTVGDFDVARALSVGWQAAMRNGLPWFGVMVLSIMSIVLAVLFCVLPVFVVAPLIAWGSTRFTLDAIDGDADLGTLFAGFSRTGELLFPMLGFGLAYLVLSLPGTLAGAVFQYGPMLLGSDVDPMVSLLGNLAGNLLSVGWSVVVMSRFVPALYLVVDQNRGVLEALSESWSLTERCWGRAMLLQVAGVVVMILGFLACCVGIIPAAMVVAGAQASMYRQVTGRG